MLTFSSKGKACLKRLGGKVSGIKISSLPGESPSHSPPTLCLGSHLLPVSPCSIAFFCSSPFCVSFTLPLFSSIPYALDVTSSGKYECKPGPMATPFPCHFDLPSQPWLSGATDALRPSVWRRAAATTTAKLPPGRGWVVLVNHC